MNHCHALAKYRTDEVLLDVNCPIAKELVEEMGDEKIKHRMEELENQRLKNAAEHLNYLVMGTHAWIKMAGKCPLCLEHSLEEQRRIQKLQKDIRNIVEGREQLIQYYNKKIQKMLTLIEENW